MAGPRYRLVTGKFYARFDERQASAQPEPDGDTIRFVPDNPFDLADPEKFKRYGFRGPKLDEFGISIRFEGIDALETHFSVKGLANAPELHQELKLANAARDKALELAGFTEVKYEDPQRPNTITSVKNNPANGFVLANGIDGNGRLLGFVYAGTTEGVDSELKEIEERGRPASANGPVRLGLPSPLPVHLTPERLKKSINWQLVDAGLAYAELYTSLPLDLARVLAGRVRELRENPPDGSIWDRENVNTNQPFTWNKQMDSLGSTVIFPKLFRRLAQYAADISQQRRPQAFLAWLKDGRHVLDRDDRLLLPPLTPDTPPPNCEFGNLHDLIKMIEEDGGNVTLILTQDPENVIVLPDSV